MNQIFALIPGIESDEAIFIESLLKDKTDEQIKNFVMIYRGRRKDVQTVLLTALIGFFGFAGIHRFLLNQVGMGLLYFFTGGLCAVGTIIDLINHKSLTFEYNQQVAREVAVMV